VSEAHVNGFVGVDTESNQLDPEKGVLAAAVNCAIERPGVLQPRRGLSTEATLTAGYKRVYRLWNFQSTTMLHFDDGTATQKLGYVVGGVHTVFSGANNNPGGTANYRLHEVQVGDTLFVTTSTGIRRFSDFSTDGGYAGVPAMPDMDRSNSTLAAAGSLIPNNNQRAYRSLLVYRPSTGPERAGAPSGRLVLRNATGGTVDPTVRVLLPKAVNTASTALTAGNWWVQLYSSDNSGGVDTEPDDNVALCYEYLLQSADITAGYVDIVDKTPFTQCGSALYTNESQGGTGSAKEPPPHAMALGKYRDCFVLGYTTGRQYLELSILAVGGSNGIQDTDTITITDGTSPFTVTAKTAPAATTDYKIENTGTASQDIKLTAQNLCAAINRHASNTICYAQYGGIPGDVRTLGRIILEARTVNGSTLQPFVGTGDKRTCFEPQLPETAGSSTVQSTADSFGNAWALSEPSEPDAFPPFRAGRMGAGNIIWISALEDACFFWHDSGEVWMMSGDPGFGADLGTLRVERKYVDLRLLGQFCAVVVDDKVVALTDRGVVALSPSGYEVLSRPVDSALRDDITAFTLTTVRQKAFAVAHPASRRVQFWLVTQGSSKCYEFNLRTNAWTTRGGTAVQEISAGYYQPDDNLVRYSNTTDGTSSIFKEGDEAESNYQDGADAISSTVTFPPFVMPDGSTPKQLRELQLTFEGSAVGSITATVTTELGSASVTASSQGTGLFRFSVPQSVQRGVRHTVSLAIGEKQNKWRLSGAKFLYRAYAPRGNK
jgi:hypothetical protein